MSGIDTELFPYQQDSVQRIDDFNGRALVALAPGLGKTIISLRWLHANPDSFPALVICPASLKFNWQYEAQHYIGVRASICEGRTPTKENQGFELRPRLTIINFDILKDWIPYLKRLRLKTIIIDETQYLMNTWTKRTKAALHVTDGVPNIIALSGTPLTNKPAELWPILKILLPDTYTEPRRFYHEFCGPKWTRWGWDFSGASNLDRLHKQLLSQCMIRYRKEDVLKDLPDKVWNTVPCELSDPDEYMDASRDFMGWIKKNLAHKAKAVSKAEGLARIGYLLRLASRLKLKSVVEWSNRFLNETDEKLVLFAHHQKAVDVLMRRINCKKVKIDGSVANDKRQVFKDQFQKDPETRLFVGSSAAREGLTLTAASECGIVEPPWVPGHLTQYSDRLHRIGQKNTVFVNLFVAMKTLEEDVYKLLRKKQEVVSAVLDGGETPADTSVYEELMKIIEGRLI